jgi:hypothetical protein
VTARDEVLEWGLRDWVALERIHEYVAEESAGESIAVIQSKVIDLITDLVSSEFFVIGDTSGELGRFVPWDVPLDEALTRIRWAYITNFDDKGLWGWYVWLDLTEKGRPVAEEIMAARLAREQQS